MRGSVEKGVRSAVSKALGVPIGAVSLDTILTSDFGDKVSWCAVQDQIRSRCGVYVDLCDGSTPKVSDIVALVKANAPDSGVRGFEPTIREKVGQVIASVAGLPAGTVSSHSRMYGDRFDVDKEGLDYREARVRTSLSQAFDIADDFIELGQGALVSDVVAAIEAALESDVDRDASLAAARKATEVSPLGFAVEPVAEAVA